MVLPEITQNYGTYRYRPYDNYVGNAPRLYGNYHKVIKTKNALLVALSI